MLATDYWNSTLLKTGEHLDKQINVTTKIGNTYLTDDAGDAVVRTIDLHVKSENKVQGSTRPNQVNQRESLRDHNGTIITGTIIMNHDLW